MNTATNTPSQQFVAPVLGDDFAVARISKAGKTTYRGAVGLLTSGNRAELNSTATEVVRRMLRNGTYRPILRELVRVFPTSALSKASNVRLNAEKELTFCEAFTDEQGRDVVIVERFDINRVSKATALQFANAVIELRGKAKTEWKGEKALYADILAAWVDELDAISSEVAQLEALVERDAQDAGVAPSAA